MFQPFTEIMARVIADVTVVLAGFGRPGTPPRRRD